MVLDFSLTDPYSGRPAFNGYLIAEGSQEIANNRTTFRVRLYARNPGGSSLTFDLTPRPWAISIGGRNWSGSAALDFRGGQASILIADFWTGWYSHNSAGNLTIGASFSHGGGIFGTAAASNPSISINRIPKPPGAVPTPTFQSATTTSINYGIVAPSDNGGAAVTTYNQQVATDAAFSNIVAAWNSGASNQVASPLAPGTAHWIRYRAVNSRGPGPWSAALNATTLPAVPPGMTVTPRIDGKSASVALTPPSGVSTVTSYRVERRPIGGAATVYNSPTSPIVITGLTPGTPYEYRASAFIGSYQTPWTDWATVSQPNPNTNPGDYFDGSSADTPDIDFQWTSTVNNSTSRAMGKRATGWRTFAEGVGTSGAPSGVQVRVTGGRSGVFASRVTFFGDATAAGYRGGTAVNQPGLIDVAESGVYWGSVYVLPSRAQRMAADIQFYDVALAPLGAVVVGVDELVPSGSDMTRLTVQATAPAGAEWASVGWRDVAGDGWSPWLGGESVLQDDAMVSIGDLIEWFSGDTPETAQFLYSWLGAPNASESQRTTLDTDTFDPLADPDCPPIPSAPEPPAIVDDCLDEVGTWRRYWAIIPADQVSDWLALVPTIYVTTGPLAARQVRIRVYRNPDNLDPVDFPANDWDAEQIISYIPPLTTLTLDGVAQRVWAEVDDGEPISADRLLYGTGGGPATWPVLSCGTAYLISFDVPLDAPEGNLSVEVSLTTRTM